MAVCMEGLCGSGGYGICMTGIGWVEMFIEGAMMDMVQYGRGLILLSKI